MPIAAEGSITQASISAEEQERETERGKEISSSRSISFRLTVLPDF
jgi:hypothetical protein